MKLSGIYKQLLNEDFKTQAKKFMSQGYESNIIDDYIKRFKIIRDAKYKSINDDIQGFNIKKSDRLDIDKYPTFRELEVFVDYVGGKHAVKSKITSNDIITDGKPVYNENGIEVYYADNPRACIKYKGNVPYSWCVARSDSSNMFYTYRFKPYEPAFYFVKDVEATKKELGLWNIAKNVFSGKFKNKYHFFVIQVPKNLNVDDVEQKQYIVTSANNDGDTQMSWNDVIALNPKLKNIREVLKPKPFTEEERKSHDKFRKGVDDREFKKLSYEDKRTYLDIYPTIERPITTSQFLDLPDDLKNLYVSFGIGLDDVQYNSIKNDKNLLKRYAQISERKFEHYIKSSGYERKRLKMMYTEIIVLKDENIKEYLNSLNDDDIFNFIKLNGSDKLEMLEKYAEDKLGTDFKTVKELLKGLIDGNDDAIEKFDEMLPNNASVRYGRYGNLLFELPNDFNFKDDLKDTFNRFQDSYFSDYHNSYFDGWDEGIIDELDDIIESLLKDSKELNAHLKLYGVKNESSVLIEILKNTDNLDDINNKIDNEFTNKSEEAKDSEYTKLRDKFYDLFSYDEQDEEILIDKDSFIALIVSNTRYLNDFKNDFEDTMNELVEDLLTKNNLPSDSSSFYEYVDERGTDFNVDYDSLNSYVEDKIIEAIDEMYEDEDDEESEDNNTQSKYAQLLKLNQILKTLNQDEGSNSIENELVKIEFHRDKIKGDTIYTNFYDKKNKKSYEGFMKFDDIPTYFSNYKLFEEINKINKIIKN